MSNPVSERTRQRRRILRAAAGVPVVFTLPSGAVLASTSIMCAENSADEFLLAGQKPKVFESAPDMWMRVRVPKLLMFPEGVGGGNGNDAGRVPGFNYPPGTLSYYKVENDVAVEFTPNQNGANQPDTTEEYYFILANNDGLTGEIALSIADVDNPIAGHSCWNSLKGTSFNSNVII